MVTLIEEQLKTSIKNIIMKDALIKINKKIKDEVIKLDDYDNKLYNYLLGQYLTNTKSKISFEGIAASTELSYNFFRKYEVIDSISEIKDIFMNRITLNPLLSSQSCRNKVDERYIKVLQILFNTNKLNLRNNLAHCGFSHINYYNYNISMLLYGVLSTLFCDMCYI